MNRPVVRPPHFVKPPLQPPIQKGHPMQQQILQSRRVLILLAVALTVAGRAGATIVDLETAQQGEASLANQWTFEGATKTIAYEDKEGSLDLGEFINGTAGTVTLSNSGLFTSKDTSSQTVRFSNNTPANNDGTALRTSGAYNNYTTATYELLFTTESAPNPTESVIGSTTTTATQRHYFRDDGGKDHLGARAGFRG